MDWTVDWAFLYEISCLTTTWFAARLKRDLYLDDKVQREGQMGVLPRSSPSLDIYSLITTITFFFIKATPDLGTPSCAFLIIIRPPLKTSFPNVPLYLENLISQSKYMVIRPITWQVSL